MITTNNRKINNFIKILYDNKVLKFKKNIFGETDYRTVSFYLCQVSGKPDSCIIIENICNKKDEVLSYKMAVVENMNKIPVYLYKLDDDFVLTYTVYVKQV